jgi:hypothetical protein
MSSEPFEEKLSDELKSVEQALRGLTLAAGTIDRDRLMYLAGRASIERPISNFLRFAWPLATAALLLLSLGLSGGVLYLAGMKQQIVVVQRDAAPNTAMTAVSNPDNPAVPSAVNYQTAPSGGFNYMQLRNAVLVHGVDALPPEPVNEAGSKSPRVVPHFPSLRDNLLLGS